MKILVTGGTGFTGALLVSRLLDMGHTVRSLDNQPGIFYDELKEKGAELITGSVTDRQIVMAATQGMEFVFHLAAAFRKLNAPQQLLLRCQRQWYTLRAGSGRSMQRTEGRLLQYAGCTWAC